LFGAGAALGGKLWLVFSFGAVGGLGLIFAPVELVVGFFLFVTFVVVGPIASFSSGQLGLAQWVPYMLAVVLLVRAPMERYQASKVKAWKLPSHGSRLSPVMWAVAFYFLCMGISLVSNLPSPLQAVVGAKQYIFIWGVFFLLVASDVSARYVEGIWRGLLLVAVLQVPFVVYQRLFEASIRFDEQGGRMTALDAVVGTFPGGVGGGANGALAMFCVLALALATSLHRSRMLSPLSTFAVVAASFLSIAIGEVKVVVVVLPLAFLVLNRRDAIRRPLFFLGGGVLVLAIVGGVITLYQLQGTQKAQERSTMEHIELAFSRILDPNNIQPNGYVSRFAGLHLWYRDGRSTAQTRLFGYGPGASHLSTTGKGVVAARFAPLKINSTTAAAMLWDIGLIGLAAFVVIIIIAFFEALKLAALPQIPAFHRCALETSAVMMALAGAMIPYGKDLVALPQFQVLFLLALFQILYWHSRSNDASKVVYVDSSQRRT
jgi:hypothetical protein